MQCRGEIVVRSSNGRLREVRSRKNALDLIRRAVFCWRLRNTPALGRRQATSCHRSNVLFALVARGRARSAGRIGAARPWRARRGGRAEPACSNGWCLRRRSRRRGARGAVSPARRGAVSARGDCACHHAERAASRANAAAGIPRAGGLAGGARLCRAGARTSRPWRDRRKISRGPGRLRRGRLRPLRPRHRGRDRRGRRPSAQATLHPAGRHGRRSGIRPAAGARWRWPAKIPKNVAAIIAFAPGRGGRANDFPNQVCAPHTLIAAAGEFGKAARVPVTWLVAANDSYFSPAFSRQLADAFRGAGGKVDFHVLPASRRRGPLAGGNRRRRQTRRRPISIARLKARSPTAAKKR